MAPDLRLGDALAEEAEPVDTPNRLRERDSHRVRPGQAQLPVGEAPDLRGRCDQAAGRAPRAWVVAAACAGPRPFEARRFKGRLREPCRQEDLLSQRLLIGGVVLPCG